MSPLQRRRAAWGGLGLLVVVFTYFVWPTPWRYFTGFKLDLPMRAHRLTGRVQYLETQDGCWHAIELTNVVWGLTPRSAATRTFEYAGRSIQVPIDASDDEIIQIVSDSLAPEGR